MVWNFAWKKKRWHGALSHWCREGKTLVVRPLKKNFFMCVFPHALCCLSPGSEPELSPINTNRDKEDIYSFLIKKNF